ncbi:hypothetical protein FSP39_020422 [Pinctada imbricata]|uniref:Heat shock 70 kDa protein 12A n=1 Tax=Pinctada imbricata TaxID=66713 RepID=A0AA89C4A1_PINIB|nr:hypothetical protein FSP39_020422 [Pinctada imbricata]
MQEPKQPSNTNAASGEAIPSKTVNSRENDYYDQATTSRGSARLNFTPQDRFGNILLYQWETVEERTQWSRKGIEDQVVNEEIKHEKLVVAAIDFGTHGSGFAFCTRSNYRNKQKIDYQTWNSGTSLTYKAPTSVLLKPDGTFQSFGYDAERDYNDLDSDEDRRTHYLFRQFKMTLFKDPTLSERTKLKDITDKEKPAVDVFAAVIRYFKETLQKKLELQGKAFGFNYDDVYWVITVPAIWNLKAKQFMRIAATKAGLKDNQLSLALEPEAASLYCRRVPVQVVTMSDGAKQIASLIKGSRYLVLDLGGGTVDITAHEVSEDGGLRELHQACGGNWGGNRVNDQFVKFLEELFGNEVITKMRHESPQDWLDLILEFETKKCSYVPGDSERIMIRIPVSFIGEHYINKVSLSHSGREGPFADKIQLKGDKLIISADTFEGFFTESVNNIMTYVRNILDSSKVDGVGSMLVVGGYSESPLITRALKTNFSNLKVVVPTNSSLAVLSGAVIYGFEPDIVASRVASYTYGIAKQKIWKKGDPDLKKSVYTTKKGLHWCDDVFDKHVEIGQVVKIGEFQPAKDYYPIRGDQKSAVLEFYASTEKDPKFVDYPNTELVGFFSFDLTERQEGDDGKVLVRIGVGGTELEVEVKEASTGRIFKTFCNFLP